MPGAKPAESKNTFLAIRVPYRSRIEIPDPLEIASCYRALGYHEDMIKNYRINIDVTKAALSGKVLGHVLRNENISSSVLENQRLIKDSVQIFLIEGEKCLSGDSFRDKILEN